MAFKCILLSGYHVIARFHLLDSHRCSLFNICSEQKQFDLHWCFLGMCKERENSELRVSFLWNKSGFHFSQHSLHCLLSSLPLVSCFDNTGKGQLYQKFGKLSYCRSLARDIKCFPWPVGLQEAVPGHWSDADTVTCYPSSVEEEWDLCFYLGYFLKGITK